MVTDDAPLGQATNKRGVTYGHMDEKSNEQMMCQNLGEWNQSNYIIIYIHWNLNRQTYSSIIFIL